MPTATFLDADGLNQYHQGVKQLIDKKYLKPEYVQDIKSKNLLPNMRTTTTINGVTFTVNDDGSVTVNGTATATAEFDFTSRADVNTLYPRLRFGVGTYAISGCPLGGGSTKYEIGVNTTGNNAEKILGHDYGGGGTFEVSAQDANKLCGTWIIVRSGQTVNNLTFYPMIRLASIADDIYVPYAKTNVDLTNHTYVQDWTSKNLLPNTAGSVSGNGLTITANANGSVTVSGTATANVTYYFVGSDSSRHDFQSGTFIVSDGVESGDSANRHMFVNYYEGSTYKGQANTYSTPQFTLGSGYSIRCGLYITNGTALNTPVTFCPMIRPSSAPSGYVPYAKTNVELTNYLLGAVIMEKVTSNDSETLSAGLGSNRIFYIDKAGYTPIGVIGYGGSGTAGISFSDVYIDTIHTAKAYYANNTSSSKTINSLFVQILYIKN